jgi:biopolymer transport protein ExbB
MTDNGITDITSNSLLENVQHAMPFWFQEGGLIMWALLLLSLITTVITLDRLFNWINYFIKKEDKALLHFFLLLDENNKNGALSLCQTLTTPALVMLKKGIEQFPHPPKHILKSIENQQVKIFSQGQATLKGIILISPILGLLGSAIHLIQTLSSTAAPVSASFAYALFPFVAGLTIMLLTIIPFLLFRDYIESLTCHLQNVAMKFIDLSKKKAFIENPFDHILDNQTLHLKFESNEKEAPQLRHYDNFQPPTQQVKVTIHSDNNLSAKKITNPASNQYFQQAFENNKRTY